MSKDKIIQLLLRLLNTSENIDFLRELKEEDLEKMVVIIRERIEC